jgi:hypothetical protein
MEDTISAEEKMGVVNLIADYAFRVDSGDLDGYVNNFAPDGIFENPRGGHHGREAIRAAVGKLFENGGAGPTSHLRHIMGIPSIHGTNERVRSRTYVFIPGDRPSADGKLEVYTPLVGTYTDDIIKVNGEWKFERRNITMHLIGPERRELPAAQAGAPR